jgi:CheY-like chemotaxis protein
MALLSPASAEPLPFPSGPRHSSVPRTGGAASQRTGGASVLIAEDHEDSRDALCTLLAATGYEAVAEARARRPDLILMDMMMPGMDGLEATRTLRADPDFPQVPIVAVTAMEGAREHVLAAGCDDWVSKPIDIRSFLARIPGWLDPARTGGD